MNTSDEDELLKAVALRNASSILKARQRAEQELVQARDALERKTEELALSLSMMKATLDSTTDGILVTDARHGVTGYNEKFVQMWQVPRSAMNGDASRVLDIVAGAFDHPEAFKRRIDDIYLEGSPTSFDLLATTDGRVIERQSRPQVVDGRIAGHVWSYRDITEQRKAEEALRDESRVLELLNRTGRNLASKLDLREVIQAVTDAGTQISGAKFGVFGPAFSGDGPIRRDDITQDKRPGQLPTDHGMPPGHLPMRSYLAVPVLSRSGETIGGLFFGHPQAGVFTERSERIVVGMAAQAAVAMDNARLYEAARQSAEERRQLLESERSARNLAERMGALKDNFLATLSHELRTPLSAILGWVHILRRGPKSPQDLDKGLDTIERNSRAQIQLIDDLLDMNRIAAGKVRLDVQPVEPIAFIEAALESVRPAAEAKGVRIERMLDPSAGTVSGDPGRLQQVMGNLLSNAVKFTPPGGAVRVSLEREASQLKITVADSGIGIKTDFVDHVFERFRQGDASTTRRYGGLGLGLSIVKSLVELHGGTVHAASAGEGQGASFIVSLPLPLPRTGSASDVAADPGGAIQLAPVFSALDLAGLTILVVDDDDDGRDLVHRVLRECDAQVLTAGNATDALALIERHRPDVMVSDIGMPEVDGFALLKSVRNLGSERGGDLPAVALTAFARPEDRRHALRSGFMAHLTKPVEPPELLATVARAAGRAG